MKPWSEHIISDKDILLGKPTIKGTRISLELILERLADGWTIEDLLISYPTLKKDDIAAVFSYVYEFLEDGLLLTQMQKTAS
jgi:uncharacterized protein (DUF433 family)